MFKLFRLAAFVTLIGLFNAHCKKENETALEKQKGIHYKEINSTLNFNQTSGLKLDINEDGAYDFEIYKDKYKTDMDSLKGFFVKNLADHKMIEIKLTHNPLFDCMNLMSYLGEEVISGSLTEEYSWDSKNGLLALRHEPNPTFIARWSDGTAKIMAVRLSISGKTHYGWIKLRYSRENNSITVVSYGYNRAVEGPIKAGQQQ
ncbi:hypothetical protein [Desertivirga arenae]|uniref:hypothetical protein n=1 Tax=Desertivirga arenae TaxID=2810309 RepID=UPI001A961CF9|nr:hypothetical protein [Pedobacter sp. SYSU D00823]